VRVVELDPVLAAELEVEARSRPGLEVWQADAVTVDLDELTGAEPWSVAANLPYSVGTPIFRRMLRRPDLFPDLVVMVQREVAERMVAPAGGRQRGLLTLEVELAGDAEILFDVPPGAFAPPPKVTSAVVRFVARDAGLDEGVVRRVLSLASVAFTHRRKKLTTTLRAASDSERVRAALDSAGVSEGSRPEHLVLDQWVAVAEALAPEPRG